MKPPGSGCPAIDRLHSALTGRFLAELERLWPERGRLGLAVSGGTDSLALLLLAQAALPGRVAVATVDHGLRPEAAAEAAFVSGLCQARGIPHATLAARVAPGNVQSEARKARYAALAGWLAEAGLDALATAHQADDQAETLVMRLNRASGLAGLAGVRPRGLVPGTTIPLLRPLLGWRRAELADLVESAGITPVEDPSNRDQRFDRVRIRSALAGAEWLAIPAWAASAAHLADAQDALEWAAEREWAGQVEPAGDALVYRPAAPLAIRLRVVTRIIATLGQVPRGSEVARLVEALGAGQAGTLGAVVARPGRTGWHFTPEPPRQGKAPGAAMT